MRSTIEISRDTHLANPLDIVEKIVEFNDWTFDRRSDEEMAVQVPGTWCDFSMYFAWNDDMGAMHFTCAFDMRVPSDRRQPVYELLAEVNERLWMGHFGCGLTKVCRCTAMPCRCAGRWNRPLSKWKIWWKPP